MHNVHINVIKKILYSGPLVTQLSIVLSNDLSFEPFLCLKKTITSLSKFWLIGASNQKLVADWPNFERLGENGQENIFVIILVHTRLHRYIHF